MPPPFGGAAGVSDTCPVCGHVAINFCANCYEVRYCSKVCQICHWKSEHKTKCKRTQSSIPRHGLKGRKVSSFPTGGSSKILKQSNKILFPYEEFVQLFNWEALGYPPSGLSNCGNSCFANVVLQCLACTRPLVAYLLEKRHKENCQMTEWCFLCEFQIHVERAKCSLVPFSPINFLLQLRHIGGNLQFGMQEDAHEFMRFAIDKMQSACLDEYGGRQAVRPRFQETTLVQHIFGGRLQSQVTCSKCKNVSDQFENMMDITVEIHEDAGSLEECLHHFIAEEELHGDNMYKCDCCNEYVKARKWIAVECPPNILTIALKRFQSGIYGKLNKRVTFPETLDFRFYLAEPTLSDGNDVYKLYAVIVHLDSQNASYFGHYICYVKDFHGNWYKTDDSEVSRVDLADVLSQTAYMLLYSRTHARPSCLLHAEMLTEQENEDVDTHTVPTECSSSAPHHSSPVNSMHSSSPDCPELVCNFEEDLPYLNITEDDALRDVNIASSEDSLLNMDTDDFLSYDEVTGSPVQVEPIEIDYADFRPPTPMFVGRDRGENYTNPSYVSGFPDFIPIDKAKKTNVESSGAKRRSLFLPSFLVKRPWKEPGSVSTDDDTKDAAKKLTEDDTKDATKKSTDDDTKDTAKKSTDDDTKDAAKKSTDDDTKDAAKKSNDDDTKDAAKQSNDADTKDAAKKSTDDDTKDAAKQSNDDDTKDAAKQSTDDDTKDAAKKSTDDDTKDAAKQSNADDTKDAAKQSTDDDNKDAAKQSTDDDTKDAANKSTGESSVTELEPSYTPGFACKPPKKRLITQENNMLVEVNQRRPILELKNHIDDWERFLPYKSHCKDEDEACLLNEDPELYKTLARYYLHNS